MKLIEINNTIEKLENNCVNVYINNEELATLINESNKLVEIILTLPTNSISRLNKIFYTNMNNKTIISNKLLKQLQESVKNHISILTRAQKQKILQEQQQQKREERKESKEEEEIWNEVKSEVFKFNDKLAIQSHVYETLWGARDINQLTNLQIFRQCQRTDAWCNTIIEYLTNKIECEKSIELQELKKYQQQLHQALLNNEFPGLQWEGIFAHSQLPSSHMT